MSGMQVTVTNGRTERFGDSVPRLKQDTTAKLAHPELQWGNNVKITWTHITKYSIWLFINTVKQSLIFAPVGDFRSSRKCLITIQTARHKARVSHTVVGIVVSAFRRVSSALIFSEQWRLPERIFSTDMCAWVLRITFIIMIWAYPLKHQHFLSPS
jgi:hypothetical protein